MIKEHCIRWNDQSTHARGELFFYLHQAKVLYFLKTGEDAQKEAKIQEVKTRIANALNYHNNSKRFDIDSNDADVRTSEIFEALKAEAQ